MAGPVSMKVNSEFIHIMDRFTRYSNSRADNKNADKRVVQMLKRMSRQIGIK